jgi:hypothetical protein
MKYLTVVAVVLFACGKKSDDAPAPTPAPAATPAPPAAPPPPVEDVTCKVAAKAYAEKMAVSPGNILSNAKPDKGLIYYTAISMEDYCVGEGGCCIPWTPEERACAKNAADITTCFKGAALAQINSGLSEVVTTALANQKANAAAQPVP